MSRGLSLLKKLGLNDDEDQTIEKDEDLKIRPKYAGLSKEIDGIQGESPVFEAVGAWKVDGPEIPDIKHLKLVKPQTQFTKSETLLPLQTAICQFHENIEQHKTNDQIGRLKDRAETIEKKIKSLKDERKRYHSDHKSKKELSQLLHRFQEIPSNFEDAFKLVKLMAANPSYVAAARPKFAKYQQEKKNPFEVSHLSMVVAAAFSSKLIQNDIFFHGYLDEWETLRNWLYDIQSIRTSNSKNMVPDKLWKKFLRTCLFPKITQKLVLETSDACANWANFWFEKGLLTESNLMLFFTNVAKPFLINNLDVLCRYFKINAWIELAQTEALASQFAVIVRIFADESLKKWHPPSPFAQELLKQWPHVLGNSLDFMYHTVAPKLSIALSFGDISALTPWVDILPISLTASLVADSYIKHYYTEITKIIKTDIKKSIELYQKAKEDIPFKVQRHPKVINRLIDILDTLKESNLILRGIKIERDPEPSTVGDLLEDIAAKLSCEFLSKGTIDGRASYSINNHIFGVHDGVLFVKKEKNWIPIFVKDIPQIVKE